MATSIGFWTPVMYGDRAISSGQRVAEHVDSYFHLWGEVAVVVPGLMDGNSIGVKLQEGETIWWQTALKVMSYFSLIIPTSLLVVKGVLRYVYPADFYISERVLANGTKEIGSFVNGVLQQGVRVEKGVTVFVCPKLLLGKVEKDGVRINFAEVTIGNKLKVIPVQKASSDSREEYTKYLGSPVQALITIAQDTEYPVFRYGNCGYGASLRLILEHPNNHEFCIAQFFETLQKPDAQGVFPLYAVNESSLLEILNLAKEYKISIDPKILETFFRKSAVQGSLELVQALLALDSSVISQSREHDSSFFVEAALSGRREVAEVLLEAILKWSQLTKTEWWIALAFNNGHDKLTKEAFITMSEPLKTQLFQVANMYVQKEFLQKLKDFGMKREPAAPERAGLFSYNMDILDMEAKLRDFLKSLRKEGLLLTKQEFQSEKEANPYFSKSKDIGRVLGRNYIARTADELGLAYIRVPKKIVVIQPEQAGSPFLRFTNYRSFGVRSSDLQVYAEGITPIDRRATREEMMGLLDLIAQTGFNDFLGHNLMMGKNHKGEEGIYFIDTEYANFSRLPSFDTTGHCLGSLVAAEDHLWLKEELQRRSLFIEIQTQPETDVPLLELDPAFMHKRTLTIPIAELTDGERAQKAS